MLINELRLRAASENAVRTAAEKTTGISQQESNGNTSDSPFALELKTRLAAQNGFDATGGLSEKTTAEELAVMSGINFSRHAVERINQRNIDVISSNKLERLSKGVELAESKGSDDALVIVDRTAFVVSVRSNKVITAVNAEEMQGNIFTNIDSTVII